jgi:hypothetical protein
VKLAQASPEEYHRAFSELAAATAQHPLYMDEKDAVTGEAFEQRIDVKDVQCVLKAVHGAQTPQWLADRLMKVCEGRRDGKVSMVALCSCFRSAVLGSFTAVVRAYYIALCALKVQKYGDHHQFVQALHMWHRRSTSIHVCDQSVQTLHVWQRLSTAV